jgi:hypothetical protein
MAAGRAARNAVENGAGGIGATPAGAGTAAASRAGAAPAATPAAGARAAAEAAMPPSAAAESAAVATAAVAAKVARHKAIEHPPDALGEADRMQRAAGPPIRVIAIGLHRHGIAAGAIRNRYIVPPHGGASGTNDGAWLEFVLAEVGLGQVLVVLGGGRSAGCENKETGR